MRFFAPIFVIILFTFCDTTAYAALVKLAIMHRHGARSGSSLVDGQVICAYPYCQLTSRGIDQLRTVGRYINMTYGSQLGLPPQYNVSYITSVSTAVPRVVVSAEAFIMGVYDGQEPLPFIQFDPDNVDTMMSQWNSVPSFILQNRYNVSLAYVNPITLATMSSEDIEYIANYLGLYDQCVVQNSPYTCVAIVADNYASNYTNGLPVDPRLTLLYPTLRQLVARFVNFMMGYQPLAPNNTWSREVGSLGYQWAQDMIGFFNTPPSANSITVLKHYAAHDWSLSALYGAVGHVTEANAGDAATVPQFGQTVVFELHSDGGGAPYIVPKMGYPTEEPNVPITFGLSPMAILCAAADGSVYNGTNGCPLEDFSRFVASTAPQAPNGQCYYTPEMMAEAQCLDSAMPPMGSSCLFYRQACPLTPCALSEGSLADPRFGYGCSSLQEADDPPYFAATVAALVVPSVLAGAIAGFYGAAVFRRRLFKEQASAEERLPFAQERS